MFLTGTNDGIEKKRINLRNHSPIMIISNKLLMKYQEVKKTTNNNFKSNSNIKCSKILFRNKTQYNFNIF